MRDVKKIQESLEGLSPKPLPPELREKILTNILQRQREFFVIAPLLRTLFVISSVLIGLVFFCDSLIKNSENDFLSSVTNSLHVSELMLEKDLQAMTKELLSIDFDKNLDLWLARHFKVKKKAIKLTSYQSILEILKE